jgi:hypothetical protein
VTRCLTLAGLLLAALAACAAAQKDKDEKDKDKPKPKVYKTPQDCFDALQTALQKRDAHLLVATLTPEFQKTIATQMVTSAVYRRDDLRGEPAKDKKGKDDKEREKKRKERLKKFEPLFEVMDKHGLTEKATKDLERKNLTLTPKGQEAALKLLEDPAAFAGDYLAVMDKIEPDPDAGAPKEKLTDLKIDGDRATGTAVATRRVKVKDKDKDKEVESKRPVAFAKVDGGWRIAPIQDDKDKPKDAKDRKDK